MMVTCISRFIVAISIEQSLGLSAAQVYVQWQRNAQWNTLMLNPVIQYGTSMVKKVLSYVHMHA